MKKYSIIFSMLLALSSLGAATTSFQNGVSPDSSYSGSNFAFLRQDSDSPFTSTGYFNIGQAGTLTAANANRTILAFDLSGLANVASVESVTLSLTFQGPWTASTVTDFTIELYEGQSFDRSTATWSNSKDLYNPANLLSSITFSKNTDKYTEIILSSSENFTAFVEQILASPDKTLYLMVKMPDAEEVGARSRATFEGTGAATAAYRPKLTVEYTSSIPEPTTTAALFSGVVLVSVLACRRKKTAV